MRAVKALTRLHICAVSSEPWLLFRAIRTELLSSGSFYVNFQKILNDHCLFLLDALFLCDLHEKSEFAEQTSVVILRKS